MNQPQRTQQIQNLTSDFAKKIQIRIQPRVPPGGGEEEEEAEEGGGGGEITLLSHAQEREEACDSEDGHCLC
jgi:hypothetical protein